jgi:hypothetical protein
MSPDTSAEPLNLGDQRLTIEVVQILIHVEIVLYDV